MFLLVSSHSFTFQYLLFVHGQSQRTKYFDREQNHITKKLVSYVTSLALSILILETRTFLRAISSSKNILGGGGVYDEKMYGYKLLYRPMHMLRINSKMELYICYNKAIIAALFVLLPCIDKPYRYLYLYMTHSLHINSFCCDVIMTY